MRVCAFDGCPELVARGYCAKHRPRSKSPSTEVTGTRQWRKLRERVLRRDNGICYYCGKRADSVDHITPISKGGATHAEDNLVAACRSCNFSKGNRPEPKSQRS